MKQLFVILALSLMPIQAASADDTILPRLVIALDMSGSMGNISPQGIPTPLHAQREELIAAYQHLSNTHYCFIPHELVVVYWADAPNISLQIEIGMTADDIRTLALPHIQQLPESQSNGATGHQAMELLVRDLIELHPQSVVVITTDENGPSATNATQTNWYGAAVGESGYPEDQWGDSAGVYLGQVAQHIRNFERRMSDFDEFLTQIIERHFVDVCRMM